MFCTYIVEYLGNKMPRYYIGSTSIEKIKNGYRGSVSSKAYKALWNSEDSNMFKVEIMEEYPTRVLALEAELKYQVLHDVVKSTDYINLSLAQPKGFFGMDVSGKNNPMWGKSRTGEKHKGGENISSGLKQFYNTDGGLLLKEKSRKRLQDNNPSQNPETMEKIKASWKDTGRGLGMKNGMFGQTGRLLGKKLYNNGKVTKAFIENEQPDNWVLGRHIR